MIADFTSNTMTMAKWLTDAHIQKTTRTIALQQDVHSGRLRRNATSLKQVWPVIMKKVSLLYYIRRRRNDYGKYYYKQEEWQVHDHIQ